MINKKFLNNLNGNVIEVIGLNDGIAELNDGEKILASRLIDPNLYTEYIDPNLFFETRTYDDLIDGVKNIKDLSRASNSDSRIVVRTDDAYEDDGVYHTDVDETDLTRKAIENQKKLADSVRRQQESIERQINGEPISDKRNRVNEENDYQQEPIERLEVRRLDVDDSMTQMFKNVKKSHDLKIDLSLMEKVPRRDFMEMWEESYEHSIVEYFADEFVNKLISDPSNLRSIIVDSIKSYIYGNSKEDKEINTQTESPKRRGRKKSTTESK